MNYITGEIRLKERKILKWKKENNNFKTLKEMALKKIEYKIVL